MIIKNTYIYKNRSLQLVDIEIDKKNIISSIKISRQNDNSCLNIFDAKRKVAIPGLINTHIHLGESILSKKIPENINLSKYINLTNKIFGENKKIKENRDAVCSYTALESVENGTTTLAGARIDKYCQNIGTRFFSGYILMKSSKLGDFLDNFEDNIRKLISNESNIGKYFIFIHSLNYVDKEILERVKKILDEEKSLKLMIHIAEDIDSEKEVRLKHKKSSIQVLEKYGLLNKKTFLIHANCISEEDMELISQRGAYIIHCPSTNLFLDKKVIESKYIKKLKNNLIIGTDGKATSGTTSLFKEMRLAYLIHNSSKKIITFKEIFDTVTKNPAEALGIKKYSSEISVGMPADIIFLSNSYKNFSSKNFYKELILQDRNHLISDVMINGKFIMKNKKLTNKKSIDKSFEKVLDLL